jgi:serine/threonine protein kinase
MSDDASRQPGAGFTPPVSTFTGPIAELVAHGLLSPPSRPGLLATLDHFEVLRVLGAGGMGVVLLARDAQNGRQVAIKMVRPELLTDRQIVHRFLKEAGHLQNLRHANVVEVLEVSDREQGPYFVMPYFETGSLARRIRPGQPMESEVILEIAIQICEALQFAHRRGIIHRDLKPANILLAADRKACLADFGLARTVFNDTLIEADRQECEGTAPYMSPGTAAGNAEDTRCDIYAFGALLYEMLTGEPPYKGRTTKEIRDQILAGPPRPIKDLDPQADPGLVVVAEGAMGRELRDRYADIADVLADLRRIQEGKAPVGPHGAARNLRDSVQGIRRSPAIVAVPICLAVIGLLGWLLWRTQTQHQAKSSPPPARTNAPTVPIPTAARAETTATNLPPGIQDVIKLTRAGITQDIILAQVQAAGVSYKLTSDQLAYLSNQGVSQNVIKALAHSGEAAPGTTRASTPIPAFGFPPVWAKGTLPDTFERLHDLLAPYGTWLDHPPYGQCWHPTAASADPKWHPYTQQGRWLYTDAGWYWHSDYSWGEIVFHSGRWFRDKGTWVWAPGKEWAPAWVSWREAEGYLGWAPLPPAATFKAGVGLIISGQPAPDSGFELGPEAFAFVPCDQFWDRNLAAAMLPPDKAAEVFKTSAVKNGYHGVDGVFAVEGVGRDRIATLTHREVKVETPKTRSLSPTPNPDR